MNGCIMIVAVLLSGPNVAVIGTEVRCVTSGDVSILKVADVPPGSMNTKAGIVTETGSGLVNDTKAPPGGAGVPSSTVPIAEEPALTSFGTMVREIGGGTTEK